MKPEQSEQFLIEELFNQSVESGKISSGGVLDIDKLTGDASTRRYYRVETSKETYVVCLDNPTVSDQRNKFLDIQSFLATNGVRVPKIHDYQLTRGYLLEEDLGDQTLLHNLAATNNINAEFDTYREIIDILINIHSINLKELEKSGLFTESFDYKKLHSEVEFSTKFFVKYFLNIEDESVQSEINGLFSPVCNVLGNANMVLTHRDFHSRNIMVKAGEKIVIDFQDARMGIPQYDLVSLLEDCYYKIDTDNKHKLINYYKEKMGLDKLGQSAKQFDDYYIAMSLQRIYKAIGSFAYIYHMRKDLRYIKYIGYAMENLKSFLFKDEQYDDLRKKLFEVYYAI